MDRIFNMDNKFFTFMGRVADLIILNLLFILCCIPIFTIGTSITAMYYVTLKMARNEESYIVRGFFKSFKENFKQGTVIWLVILLFILLEVADFNIMKSASGGIYTVVKYGLGIIALLLCMITLYVFPVLAKFVNTIKATVRNSLLMSLRHLPYTILMIVIPVAAVVVTLLTAETLTYGLLLWFLLGFSTLAYINSRFFVKIFDNYIPKEEEESEEEDGILFRDEEVSEIPASEPVDALPEKPEPTEEASQDTKNE